MSHPELGLQGWRAGGADPDLHQPVDQPDAQAPGDAHTYRRMRQLQRRGRTVTVEPAYSTA